MKVFITILFLSGLISQHAWGQSACLKCHGNITPVVPERRSNRVPPLWPHQYTVNWKMYEFKSETRPPFLKIPSPHKVIRGKTYYDWSQQSMVEVYFDRCIDIFPKGNQFSCKFISKKNKTYLVKSRLGEVEKIKSCCLWSNSSFWAPRPDVLRNMKFEKETRTNDGTEILWWIYDIPLPGPFGYGTTKKDSEPAAFWFPVISGWVQQNFHNFSKSKPDAQVFDLPSKCNTKIELCDSER